METVYFVSHLGLHMPGVARLPALISLLTHVMLTELQGTGGGYRPATRAPPDSPLVMMDMENGLYGCNSKSCMNNTDVPGLASEFVTAMVKGGTDSFALKGADATVHSGNDGKLNLIYDGPRPPGYTPMHKSGAIILGVGGDNMAQRSKASEEEGREVMGAEQASSNPGYPGEAESIGTFYEGVLTVGYSTDTADAAVHANNLAAGYGR